MSPTLLPREPAPFAPCIMLNLRDDPIPVGYGSSAHAMDKNTNINDNDGELFADDNMDIQDEDKYVFSIVSFSLLTDYFLIASLTSLQATLPPILNGPALLMKFSRRS